MARRGIEPAMAAAYAVFFLETVGAVMIILGLFTRFFAAALAVEFAIITFVAHWPVGFAAGRGGWEYPLFWGLILFAIALRGGGPYSLDRKLSWELSSRLHFGACSAAGASPRFSCTPRPAGAGGLDTRRSRFRVQ